eukprot:TRINITY_DN37700_c0_g1_i1.p1 TRINITY_DN37700_c0_g1~~TRINITY_DN37700_c0_g1_i1.p1  ORF type:complete len:140 (-),score=7.95 TRINITY_DN37700_c0_g1_i1:522-941(-)
MRFIPTPEAPLDCAAKEITTVRGSEEGKGVHAPEEAVSTTPYNLQTSTCVTVGRREVGEREKERGPCEGQFLLPLSASLQSLSMSFLPLIITYVCKDMFAKAEKVMERTLGGARRMGQTDEKDKTAAPRLFLSCLCAGG